MIDFLRSLTCALRDSVLARLGLAMGTLALLTFVSILISTLIADSSSGKAYAINLSGSMRMMSFRLLSEVLQPDKRRQVPATIEQYEHRLRNLERIADTRMAENAPLQALLDKIVEQWRSNVRPLAHAAIEGNSDALTEMTREVPRFVEQIDRVVQLIEEDLERQIRLLRATQFALLAVIIVLSVLTSWMLRNLFVTPLAGLLRAARTVTQGSFTARVAHTGNDELGQLGQAFNTMVGEIANMYAHLEVKVEEKTAELTRINQSLELLYRTSQRLSASDLSLDTVKAVLRDIEVELNIGHSMICISENGQLPARPILGSLGPVEMAALCGQRDCGACFRSAMHIGGDNQGLADARPVVFIPLGDAESQFGVLPVFSSNGEKLSREKLRILETVGHHISNALANMRRVEEKHRLAVLEERSVIARELHDSIAQSLSYLKIQVARLQPYVAGQSDAMAISEEIKQGLNSAYRELRELITTFRLRLDERGLSMALQEAVEEFSNKLAYPVALDNQLSGLVLSGNEEMHVLRIIREALANIEKHARATRAAVSITVNAQYEVKILVEDNGQGFDQQAIPPNHFGMTIMRDRAQSLDGVLQIETQPGAGTRIHVYFQPQKYRPQPAL